MDGCWQLIRALQLWRDHSREITSGESCSVATDSFLSSCFVVSVTSPVATVCSHWSSACGRSRNALRGQVSVFHEWKG